MFSFILGFVRDFFIEICVTLFFIAAGSEDIECA